MCLKKENGDACQACRQRVAVESLLIIGQSRTKCTAACGPASADTEQSGPAWTPNSGDIAPPDSVLTPPPSEAGSLSPPQSDDSCDLYGPNINNSAQAPVTKNTSKLAQVQGCLLYNSIICNFTVACFPSSHPCGLEKSSRVVGCAVNERNPL